MKIYIKMKNAINISQIWWYKHQTIDCRPEVFAEDVIADKCCLFWALVILWQIGHNFLEDDGPFSVCIIISVEYTAVSGMEEIYHKLWISTYCRPLRINVLETLARTCAVAVCMDFVWFTLWPCGLSLGPLVPSHIPKKCTFVENWPL